MCCCIWCSCWVWNNTKIDVKWSKLCRKNLWIMFELWVYIAGHIAGTIWLRLMLFPMVIKGQRNAVMMHNHMPTIQRLQMRMVKARKTGDVKESQCISVVFLLLHVISYHWILIQRFSLQYLQISGIVIGNMLNIWTAYSGLSNVAYVYNGLQLWFCFFILLSFLMIVHSILWLELLLNPDSGHCYLCYRNTQCQFCLKGLFLELLSVIINWILFVLQLCVWIKWHTNVQCHSHTRAHTHTRMHTRTHTTVLRLWILSGTTQVSWYQKKHSPTHIYRGHQIYSVNITLNVSTLNVNYRCSRQALVGNFAWHIIKTSL